MREREARFALLHQLHPSYHGTITENGTSMLKENLTTSMEMSLLSVDIKAVGLIMAAI